MSDFAAFILSRISAFLDVNFVGLPPLVDCVGFGVVEVSDGVVVLVDLLNLALMSMMSSALSRTWLKWGRASHVFPLSDSRQISVM